MSIPTDVTYTGVSANFDTNPASDRNSAIDLRTPLGVNIAIDTFKTQMLDQDWTLTGIYYPETTLFVGGLVGSSTTGFSITILNWYGWTFQFYQDPEPDPTGAPGLLPGMIMRGIKSFPGDTQFDLIGALIIKMQLLSPIPWVYSANDAFDTITISGNPFLPGPFYNDSEWTMNVIGGYSSGGPTKGGGWELTSLATAEHSPVTVALRNNHVRNYLSIDVGINGNPCSQILIQRRNNWISVVSPFMWNLFHRNDGTTWSSGDIYTSYDNYWICAPEMDMAQRNHPDTPLTFAAFVMIRERTSLNSFAGVTVINDLFFEGGFNAFDSDVGISPYLINSKYDAAGALVTTTDTPIQIQALMGLSPGQGEPLCIIGPAWDMFVTSKYHPIDEMAFSRSGKLVVAYRSQQAPCEATLWLALN